MNLDNWIDPEHLSEEKIQKLQTTFSSNQPFPHLEIKNFIKSEKIIELLQALNQQEFSPKQADLFQFLQTPDLLYSDDQVLKEFIALSSSPELITFMQNVTNLKLNGKIDLFASIYQDTDFLLPHDDQLIGRKIAFMLYLNDLDQKDGGALGFYETKNKTPTKIAKRIIPKAGTLVFFEVSALSFHTVEEVTTDTQRITLSGWFYG
ncbi:MAG TPA: 2OG-Fe(II) oxygenase family protein [Candidatus Nanoarchaeia archaeon]|nr:2OG-Fe(II) oxygenase family protein [Candidatus Nanoarchaeia archaeon]